MCYMFGHGGVCVQSEAARVLWEVRGVGVDQSSARPAPLSQPDLLCETDPAPNTHHHHTANHRHACAPQPIKILWTAVVGVDHAPLWTDRKVKIPGVGVTMVTNCLCAHLTMVLPVAL